MPLSRLPVLLLLLLALPFFFPLPARGQGATSAGLAGRVTDPEGAPLADASLDLTHEPTGSTYPAATRADGRYAFTGLRVGGPYTLRVRREGFQEQTVEGLSLRLQTESTFDFRLSPPDSGDVVELTAVAVTATGPGDLFSAASDGAKTVLALDDIGALPTVTRSLTDLVRLDPRMAVYDRDSGAISAGGKSTRYNSLLIDGVVTKDTFGLNDNGLPALKQPFSLDTIDQISVQTTPYDLSQAGFTGASVNAVTKSGTNTFRGSAYTYYRNQDMVGELTDLDGVEVPFREFTELTYGGTLGGPILRNRLFFFSAYETSRETVLQDRGDFVPDPATVARLEQVAAEVFGFDPGELGNIEESEKKDDKLLLKLDANLTQDHRLSLRYNLTEGREPIFPDYAGSGSTSFSSRWYANLHQNENYAAELFSHWSPDLSTEVKASYNAYSRTRDSRSDLPSVEIRPVPDAANPGSNGSLFFGRDANGHANELQVDTYQTHWRAVYQLPRHTLAAGFQFEQVNNYNLYIPNSRGRWVFESGVEQFFQSTAPNNATSYDLTVPAPGFTGAADWSLQTASLYLQDQWQVLPRLSLTAGLRLDFPIVPDAPAEAVAGPDGRNFAETFGTRNTGTVDGNYVIQPRLGFNLAVDEERRTQVRGGFGLFYGSAPHVWLSSSYINNGRTLVSYFPRRQGTPAFSADGDDPPIPTQVPSRAQVDYLSEDFQMPTDWKGNFAIDQKLPWWDLEATVEAQFSWVAQDIHYVHQNLLLNTKGRFLGRLPDGRLLFDPITPRYREDGYGDVILLTNTNQGHSFNYTAEIRRSPHHRFSWKLAYTYGDSVSVNDGLSSTAFSNWRSNVAPNPNDEVLGTSRYETKHRVLGVVSYRFDLGRAGRTNVSLVYDGRSGRPYSYVYGRNRDSVDLNTDGNFENDLLYVPTGLDDPLVAWGRNNQYRDTEGVAFLEYLANNPDLSPYQGRIVPRNTGTAPYIHQFDLKITHDFKVWRDHRLELSFSILNLGNLLNDQWGLEKRPKGANGGNVKILAAEHNPVPRPSIGKGNEYGYYIYRFYAEDVAAPSLYEVRSLSSRWSFVVGAKYTF